MFIHKRVFLVFLLLVIQYIDLYVCIYKRFFVYVFLWIIGFTVCYIVVFMSISIYIFLLMHIKSYKLSYIYILDIISANTNFPPHDDTL